MTKFRGIELRLVPFYEKLFISQYGRMISILTLYFKKGCYCKDAFSTFMKMFLNTLSEILSVNCASVITTSVSHSSFRLTDVVKATCTTRECIDQITRVTGKVMADLKWFTRSVK